MSEVTAVKVNDGGRADVSYHDDARHFVQAQAGSAYGVHATKVIMKNPSININLPSRASGSNKDHQHTGATNRGHYQVLSQRNCDDEQEVPIPQRGATNRGHYQVLSQRNCDDEQELPIPQREQRWTFVCNKVNRFVQDKRMKAATVVFVLICILLIAIAVILSNEATECEMLDEIANGSINCTMSNTPYNTSVGTYCSIECDERYRLHGDNCVFCQQEGNWTTLPTCELITCPAIETIRPEYGSVICTDGNTADSSCVFACEEGHKKFGPDEITCQRTGEWSVSEPVKCALRACDFPQDIEFGNVQCSNNTHKVGTTCEITCLQDHVLLVDEQYYDKDKPNYGIECLPNETWSEENLPHCVCPPCKTGDNCQWTTSWQVVKNNINTYEENSKMNYAGHEISAEVDKGIEKFKLVWRCVCKDTKTDAYVRCTKKSSFGACVHACSQLIIDMVSRGEYENPCDRSTMNPDC